MGQPERGHGNCAGWRGAIIVGFAGVAGVIAATGPARRASKLDILDAPATE